MHIEFDKTAPFGAVFFFCKELLLMYFFGNTAKNNLKAKM